jgi:hypothetical protein
MQYLVTGEFIDPGPLLSPDQLAAMIQQLIVPSHDALTYLKSEGKLMAGGMQSERGLERLSLRQTPMQSWTVYAELALLGVDKDQRYAASRRSRVNESVIANMLNS